MVEVFLLAVLQVERPALTEHSVTFAACQDNLAEQVDAAVAHLGSENIEVREAAFELLLAMGPAALAELRRSSLHPDGEVRARVRQAIVEVARRERILAIRPAPRRLSLELTEVPLAQALEAAFKPIGVVAQARSDLKYPKPLLSVTLKAATLWQTLDAVSAAGHIEIDEHLGPMSHNGIYAREWTFAPYEGRNGRLRWADAGEVRIYAFCHGYGGNDNVGMQAYVAAPPGHFFSRVEIEEAVLSDATGRDLGAVPEEQKRGGWMAPRHVVGNIAWWDLWKRKSPLTPADLAGSRTMDLRGVLRITYPHDFERVEAAFQEENSTMLAFTGCAVQVKLSRPEEQGHSHSASLSVKGSMKDRECWVWFEDAAGRRLTDAPRFQGGSIGGGVRLKGKVERVVGLLVTGEDHVRLPFEIRSVPLPPK